MNETLEYKELGINLWEKDVVDSIVELYKKLNIPCKVITEFEAPTKEKDQQYPKLYSSENADVVVVLTNYWVPKEKPTFATYLGESRYNMVVLSENYSTIRGTKAAVYLIAEVMKNKGYDIRGFSPYPGTHKASGLFMGEIEVANQNIF
jgi:hypothetical protein